MTTDTWSYLPFSSETANDFALTIQDLLIKEVDAVFNDDERLAADIRGNGTLLPSLVLLADMSERHDIFLPIPLENVLDWEMIYVSIFDETELLPAFKAPRSYLIEKVFATLKQHATITDTVFSEQTPDTLTLEADG